MPPDDNVLLVKVWGAIGTAVGVDVVVTLTDPDATDVPFSLTDWMVTVYVVLAVNPLIVIGDPVE